MSQFFVGAPFALEVGESRLQLRSILITLALQLFHVFFQPIQAGAKGGDGALCMGVHEFLPFQLPFLLLGYSRQVVDRPFELSYLFSVTPNAGRHRRDDISVLLFSERYLLFPSLFALSSFLWHSRYSHLPLLSLSRSPPSLLPSLHLVVNKRGREGGTLRDGRGAHDDALLQIHPRHAVRVLLRPPVLPGFLRRGGGVGRATHRRTLDRTAVHLHDDHLHHLLRPVAARQ
mmetsp:Transcript_42879/g.110609  ORF Transcript_42879/g.110609 Transcript_42879/m.110609 type:complete len:231 (-) Transcript_42879:581-1273(-)